MRIRRELKGGRRKTANAEITLNIKSHKVDKN